jgi:hypothetical protein
MTTHPFADTCGGGSSFSAAAGKQAVSDITAAAKNAINFIDKTSL